MHSIVKRGLRGVALLTPVKPMLLRNVRSAVSFTFDDFPASAGKVGVQILHRYDVRATYYVSGGLEGENKGDNKLYTADELRMVMAYGHEIGCHTYDHTAAQDMTISELSGQLDRNATTLRERYGVNEIHSFAFPYGIVTLPSKLLVARRFVTGRCSRAGIHVGWADLAQLRANPIGPSDESFRACCALLERARRGRSWLIFYTHDISNSPSPFGCTRAQLKALVAHAVDSGCTVLPMRNAVDFVSVPGH